MTFFTIQLFSLQQSVFYSKTNDCFHICFKNIKTEFDLKLIVWYKFKLWLQKIANIINKIKKSLKTYQLLPSNCIYIIMKLSNM